jgi:hypothetical protein
VCIAAGGRDKLILQNFRGTATAPITFINSGGQVVFNGYSDFAIKVQNSRYFRVTGTGDSRYQYGFYVNGNYTYGLKAGWKSSDMEVDHIEVAQSNGGGMQLNSRSNCSNGSDNDYDYDDDGRIVGDLDDVVDNSFVQYNTEVHHNYIHDTHSEGFYIGSNRTVYAPYGQGKSGNGSGGCNSSPTWPLHPVLKGLRVYSNTVRRSGWDGINVKGTPSNCFVYSNEVYNDSTALRAGEEAGIMISLNSQCEVYNNLVKDGNSTGIQDTGIGGKIYNNLIINPGRGYPSSDTKGSGIQIYMGTQEKSFYVWNNTIIEPRSCGIVFTYLHGSDNRIQNNIIVDPGGYSTYGNRSFVFLSWQAQVNVSNNLNNRSIYEIDFVNPLSDNYALTSRSPAVNAGLNLSSWGITFDFKNTNRPQGAKFDIGAYEYVP